MIITVSPYLKSKPYYWYIARSLYSLAKENKIVLQEKAMPIKFEPYVELLYINNTPLFIDVRDDLTLSNTYKGFSSDAIILKANYSTELFETPPKEFEYQVQGWYKTIKDRLHPFILGRSFNLPFNIDEFSYYRKAIIPKYDVVSYSGAGIYSLQTKSRIKVYDLIKEVFKEKSNLLFIGRNHYTDEKNYPEFFKKLLEYFCPTTLGTDDFFNFLHTGCYSLNFPGIACSQPFRCVDAVLTGRGIISTKIYHDLYKSFPCIELPICGYTGEGDWNKAKEILNNLPINTVELIRKADNWYSWFLSTEGMFNNQLINYLK